MKFKVRYEVEISLGNWREEYGVSTATAIEQVKWDLRDGLVCHYQDPKWTGVGARLALKSILISLPDVLPNQIDLT